MLTYDFTKATGALYKYLYKCIKEDINSGKLGKNEKMPSKRTLAKNLGISTITVENAYDQLIGEGYMYAIPKKGYYVSDISGIMEIAIPEKLTESEEKLPDIKKDTYDFSSNYTEPDNFPFSVWTKLMRENMAEKKQELLKDLSNRGVLLLREAIANYLLSFRGMNVKPSQIVVGAGTEYLYELLIKLLGKDKIYCMENPGYKKITQIYKSNDIECRYANMDENGVSVEELALSGANIAHISPTHHFPTGITMPVSRRYEILAWANKKEGRYIIEDDYDSEFRLNGRPVPPLQSIDACGKVIYMNTFSKSLTPTIRISYMVLPKHLSDEFNEKLSFYSCTVSTFEQYTLAEFIKRGYFEKHINRMRLYYVRKRHSVLEHINECFDKDECRIIENDSGLHFILELETDLRDKDLEDKLSDRHIRLQALTDFYQMSDMEDKHRFILNYSSLDMERLDEALHVIKAVMHGNPCSRIRK